MKKLTLLLMACAIAVMGFAAGGNITYELNGGVTNPDGWKNKQDMYAALNVDYNAKTGATANWTAIAEMTAVNQGIPTAVGTWDLTFFSDAAYTAKWGWLPTYLDAKCTEDGVALATSSSPTMRYNLSAFFWNSQQTGWPKSADYAVAGQPAAFMPAWKHGFAGPASYDGTVEIIIPAPYKEGFTFDGWYAAADFSGDRVTSIPAGTTGDKALYAKWVEYIPTIAQVWALGNDVNTKATGTVSLIVGNDVYIQDATGGMLLSFAATPAVAVKDQIVVSAKTAANGTKKKLVNVTVTEKTAGEAAPLQPLTLAGLKADAAKDYATYMYEWVQILGLGVQSYNGDGTSVLADDAENTISLALKLDQAVYPVGTKIDFKGVVDFAADIRLNSVIANIKKSPVPQPDPFAYPVLGDGKYSLASKWVVSVNLDNLGANPIGTPGFVRGMAAKDGKMYFVDREHKQLTILDGATGKKLAPLKLAANIFTYVDGEGATKQAGTLPFNDIKLDNAGNVLLGNCITSNKEMFQIWKIDLATGNGTLVLEEMLINNPDFAEAAIRFDAFGVYGDVNGNAIILAANASAMEVYKWTITGGVASGAEVIIIDTSEEGTYLTGLANPGTAPQVFPLDELYFYLDGNATLPTLIDMEGTVIDGFYKNVAAQHDTTTQPGSDWTINQGHNGLIEFEMGGEYFFLIAGRNTVGTPASSFRLYKWKDGNKLFSEMESMWTFPAAGMGGVSNPYRTAVPYVEVNETAKVAKLYVYTGENGYGMYEFSATPTGLDKVSKSNVAITLVGNMIKVSEEVKSMDVYSIAGQLISNSKNVSEVKAPLAAGLYIVNIVDKEGARKAQKLIVR